MKTKKTALIALFVIFVLVKPLVGALPPLYASLNEYQTLITSKELISRLDSSQYILIIERNEKGFSILTNKQLLKVDIVYDSQDHPGPAKFHLIFH